MEEENKGTLSNKLVLGEPELIYKGKWQSLYKVPFTSEGKPGEWECVGRAPPKSIKQTFGGVIVMPIAVDPETSEKKVLIEKIYRIPIQKYSLEFPAGMKDPEDDNPCTTALRELMEETGYTGTNPRPLTLVKPDPWKSNSTHCQVYVDVDLTDENNKNPKTNLEAEEDITCMWIGINNIKENLEKLAQDLDADLDQRLYTWALGIDYAKKMKAT